MKKNGTPPPPTKLQSVPRQSIDEQLLASPPPPPFGEHDFDGIRAVGQWIVAERTHLKERSIGGIVIPEAARMPVWSVLSVGAEVEKILGGPIAVGDRVMFINPTATVVHDNRGFAMLRASEVIAVLRPPKEGPRIELARTMPAPGGVA